MIKHISKIEKLIAELCPKKIGMKKRGRSQLIAIVKHKK